jgi:hypothetical protein
MMMHVCTPHKEITFMWYNLKMYLIFLFNYGDSANFDTGA